MGSVCMAQQTEPVKRAVAVKVIKAGMDSKAVLARFEAERQALALMDHPNIARVLDAGTTDGGRPFFVMELVKGMPDHPVLRRAEADARGSGWSCSCRCARRSSTPTRRASSTATSSRRNVLVALYDDRPVPKVIDFGVAKAAGQSLTDKTLDDRVRGGGRHAGVHVPGAGEPEQPGHRHPQRRVLARRAAVRTADRHARRWTASRWARPRCWKSCGSSARSRPRGRAPS